MSERSSDSRPSSQPSALLLMPASDFFEVPGGDGGQSLRLPSPSSFGIEGASHQLPPGSSTICLRLKALCIRLVAQQHQTAGLLISYFKTAVAYREDRTKHICPKLIPYRAANFSCFLGRCCNILSDEDAEADSFIGQAPPPELRQSSPFSMFQQHAGLDPFADLLQPRAVDFSFARPAAPSVAPVSVGQAQTAVRSSVPRPVPLPNISSVPLQSVPPLVQNVPPFSNAVLPSSGLF